MKAFVERGTGRKRGDHGGWQTRLGASGKPWRDQNSNIQYNLQRLQPLPSPLPFRTWTYPTHETSCGNEMTNAESLSRCRNDFSCSTSHAHRSHTAARLSRSLYLPSCAYHKKTNVSVNTTTRPRSNVIHQHHHHHECCAPSLWPR